jgi:hypothetical protein
VVFLQYLTHRSGPKFFFTRACWRAIFSPAHPSRAFCFPLCPLIEPAASHFSITETCAASLGFLGFLHSRLRRVRRTCAAPGFLQLRRASLGPTSLAPSSLAPHLRRAPAPSRPTSLAGSPTSPRRGSCCRPQLPRTPRPRRRARLPQTPAATPSPQELSP